MPLCGLMLSMLPATLVAVQLPFWGDASYPRPGAEGSAKILIPKTPWEGQKHHPHRSGFATLPDQVADTTGNESPISHPAANRIRNHGADRTPHQGQESTLGITSGLAMERTFQQSNPASNSHPRWPGNANSTHSACYRKIHQAAPMITSSAIPKMTNSALSSGTISQSFSPFTML